MQNKANLSGIPKLMQEYIINIQKYLFLLLVLTIDIFITVTKL
jgi:hypothetical protein